MAIVICMKICSSTKCNPSRGYMAIFEVAGRHPKATGVRGGASGQSKRALCEEGWSHRSEGVKEASVAPVCGG